MDVNDIFGFPNARTQVTELMPMISVSYLKTKQGWSFIGQCMFNLFDDAGKELWIRWTPQEFIDLVEEVWFSYTQTRHGLAAIRMLARENKPDDFRLWTRQHVAKAAIGAVQENASITEVADIARFMFGDCFICTNTERKTWWGFDNHHWSLLCGGNGLRQKFSRELVLIFEQMLPTLSGADQPVEAKEIFKKMRDKCSSIIRGLKEPGYKGKVMQECAEVLYARDFEDLSDEDHFLLGVKNGVYDFRGKNTELWGLRRGFPEDWITLQMNVPYNGNYTWEHEDVKEVMLFFRKVLYHQDMIDFVLGHKASCLVGGNKDKWLVIYIGETAHNGKTTIQKLDKHTFGKYCGKFSLGAVVGKTLDAGAADPEMATSKGQRLKYIDEANATQKFNFSFVKIATGNDEVRARKLYSNGGEMTPQYNLIMILNNPPEAKTSDAAIWERLVLVPCESRFIANPPVNEDEQWAKRTFKADPFIEQRLKQLSPAYHWVLTEYYKKYTREGGVKKPKAVVEKSQKYKYENDLFAQFVMSKLDKTERYLDFETLNDLYINFKQWHTDAFPKSHTPDKIQFEKELTRLLGAPEQPDSKWHSIKLKTTIKRFDRG